MKNWGVKWRMRRAIYLIVRVTIPFFEGFGSTYRIREARAQAELQQANVAEAEQQIALNVWKSYEAVRAGAQTVQQAEALQENAALAFDAAQARYRIGVANIMELLHAQDALVVANHQRIATLADWYVARLSLAASLGKLDLGQIQNG
jgi:outer membrane protein